MPVIGNRNSVYLTKRLIAAAAGFINPIHWIARKRGHDAGEAADKEAFAERPVDELQGVIQSNKKGNC